jgi:type II secretory pathway pseudopilin PulG
MKQVKNEKGITLVEVLAAVVILSIIIGSIMNFFPQIETVNNINGEKSQAINTAKQVLNKWQNDDRVKDFIKYGSGDLLMLGTKQPDVSISDGTSITPFYHFQTTQEGFIADIFIKKSFDLGNTSNSNDPDYTKAYLIKVQVSNTKGKLITETYGYIIF